MKFMFTRFLSLVVLIFIYAANLHAQQRYQSLMWKISGNGLAKPSYLYGTMHISGKMVFHLGDQFYDAVESVDVVALELEPDAWLRDIFSDAEYLGYMRDAAAEMDNMNFMGYGRESALPPLNGFYTLKTDIQDKLKYFMMYDPALLNYLLFRYGDYADNADFEEDTWLDMYIYQLGKKMGKQTIGLETYAQSGYYIRQARIADSEESERKEFDEGDIKEMVELQKQFEPAYRKQDLDLIDSLNKITASPAFDKYILVERNKVFVHTIDSVLKSGKSIFAGMGCAHLPGKPGVIEMMREMGYKVEPYNKGERSAKRRDKIDKQIYKRSFKPFVSASGDMSFSAPAEVYHLQSDKSSSSWICLDMPNGASFIVNRMKTYAGIGHRSPDEILASVDSVIYEAVAGDIVSLKRSTFQGNPTLDILNVSRRGDYQRRMILILPQEIVLLKLTATGTKIKEGYGTEFFSSFTLSYPGNNASQWTSFDKSVSANFPGEVIDYKMISREGDSPDLEAYSAVNDGHDVLVIQRHVIFDPEFLDEDEYELKRLARAFAEDNKLIAQSEKSFSFQGFPAKDVKFRAESGRTVRCRFVLNNFSYYAISAFTEDSLLSKRFFDEVRFNKIDYNDFFLHRDTVNHFSVELPFRPLPIEDYSLYYRANEKNIFEGKSGGVSLSIPGQCDVVDISYQRFHRFSDGEDTLKFYQERKERALRPHMMMKESNIIWNDSSGCVMNFVIADTACSRRYLQKVWLQHKTVFTITASYDSTAGPGDFVDHVFKSFKPEDRTYPFYHFTNMDKAFLDTLYSKDSLTIASAVQIAGEMDWSQEAGIAIRNMLKDFPQFENKKDSDLIREKLTNGLAADTSAENIAFITKQFYAYTDSASYQLDLLRILLRMKTKSAWQAYKKLVLDEPPIVTERMRNSGFTLLADSLTLSAPMIADLMQLLALDEYEEDVYALMAEALDSNNIKPEVYKPLVPQMTIEARNELKRLNGMKEDGYSFNTDQMLDYCTLLFPYRTQPEVKAFFEKAHRTRKMTLLLDLVDFDLKKKIVVEDSVIRKLALKENQIIPLYNVLDEYQATNRMPVKYSSREALIKVHLNEKFKSGYGSRETKVDSIAVLAHELGAIRNQPLEIYYCKYKKQRSKQWLGVIIAFDNSNPQNLWPGFIQTSQTIVLDADEDEMEELRKEFVLLEEENRRRINFNDGSSKFDFSWY
jgi:uncharacterized protein YbaP (TraB family)